MNCVFKVDYILDYIRINFDIIYNYIELMVKLFFFGLVYICGLII